MGVCVWTKISFNRTSDNRAFSCSESHMLSTRQWKYSSKCVSRWYDEVLGKLVIHAYPAMNGSLTIQPVVGF